MKKITDKIYTRNDHYHFDGKRTYEDVSGEMKIETLEELIRYFEVQLLTYQGQDMGVIELEMLIDDICDEEIPDENNPEYEKIRKVIHSLNVFSSWLEELRLEGKDEE